MNRHGRRVADAKSNAVMNVVCTPFRPPDARLGDMDRDTRRAYVAILYGLAEKMHANGTEMAPWRMAASMHTLIRAGVAALEFVPRKGYRIVLPDDLKYDWIN